MANYTYTEIGGRVGKRCSDCSDSERDGSTEKHLQVRKQYVCVAYGTVSPAVAIA